MAQRSHVPKFGNWDSENVPYTTYFDNARKEKDSGGKKINPNDPEENPDFFTCGLRGQAILDSHHVVQAPPSETTSGRRMTHNREERHVRHSSSSSAQKGIPDQQSSGNRKSTTSELSDRSSSDMSLIQRNGHLSSSRNKQSMGDGSHSYYPSSVKSGSYRSNDSQPQKVASVPKFGAWDETDPKSGEGFTVIFNKVKQEKKIGASQLSAGTPEPNMYSDGRKNNGSTVSKPKKCCCFF